MIRRFAGAQRDGIGRFVADPVSGQWSWSDAVFEIFGYRARSVAPSWSLIINHIPEEDRAVAQIAYELATTRIGPFSWSHRIYAGDAMRSIMVLGETSPLDGVNSLKRTGQRSGQLSENQRRHAGLYLEGYVVDLTVLRVEGARGAATEAVQSSARHRAVIEQAKGVLMLTFGLKADAAFALLVWHSQRSNRKVHVIAADLVAHLHGDGLSGNRLRLAMERILTNGEGETSAVLPSHQRHAEHLASSSLAFLAPYQNSVHPTDEFGVANSQYVERTVGHDHDVPPRSSPKTRLSRVLTSDTLYEYSDSVAPTTPSQPLRLMPHPPC